MKVGLKCLPQNKYCPFQEITFLKVSCKFPIISEVGEAVRRRVILALTVRVVSWSYSVCDDGEMGSSFYRGRGGVF